MPHGTPDWGLVGPKETIYGLDDLGEHAVRLGSPHQWDRRGDVVYITNFAEGLGIFHVGFWAAPAYGTLFTYHARHGAYCVKLVTDGDITHETGLFATLPMPRIAGMALEFTFSTRSTGLYWHWQMGWRVGVDQYVAGVHWDLPNDRLEYFGADGLWHIFAENVYWSDRTQMGNTGKMVVDTTKWEYSRFLLNGATYSMKGLGVRPSVELVDYFFEVSLGLYGLAAIEAVGYVDSVIVTQNEP